MIRKSLILLALTLLVGCGEYSDHVYSMRPCTDKDYVSGFRQSWWTAGIRPDQDGPCIPCSQATTPEARFVCFGETETKGIHGYPNAGGGGNTAGAPKASAGISTSGYGWSQDRGYFGDYNGIHYECGFKPCTFTPGVTSTAKP